MKRLAFLQALVVFILLIGSWALLFKRFREPTPATPAPETATPAPDPTPDPTAPDPTPDPGQAPTAPKPSGLSGDWQAILEQLDQAGSPNEMRQWLGALRDSVFSIPAPDAIASLIEFLASGADLKTGLAFQPGPEGRLTGAASLRALVLDWLHRLDPALAGSWARRELAYAGTTLVPDVFVIHLRNAATDPTQSAEAISGLLELHMDQLMGHEPWLAAPTSAIAEAFDILVYLRNPRWSGPLAGLLDTEEPPLLRHAAALALERLVDAQPLAVLSALADDSRLDGLPKTRAHYFARLDPTDGPDAAFLRDYLLGAPIAEQAYFLAAFPNLNLALSHNLLSPQFSNTSARDATARLRSALAFLQSIQNDLPDPAIAARCREGIERIRTQLGAD